jgi:hypothetical protein
MSLLGYGWEKTTVHDTSNRVVVYARPFFNFMCTAVKTNFKRYVTQDFKYLLHKGK